MNTNAPFVETTAFNGDQYLLEECLNLKNQFGIKTIIETGTHVGYSTEVFARHFETVHSIESKPEHLDRAKLYCCKHENILFYLGSTIQILPKILQAVASMKRVMIYLDAHWENEATPLLTELEIIRAHQVKPVLLIHDFQVPGRPDLGFDTYAGQPYTWDWIKGHIDAIYQGKYTHYFNQKVHPKAPNKRGCLFVIPTL